MNTCGCKSCGGSAARNDALLARRVVAYVPFILARRGESADTLRNRHERVTLYSKLVLAEPMR